MKIWQVQRRRDPLQPDGTGPRSKDALAEGDRDIAVAANHPRHAIGTATIAYPLRRRRVQTQASEDRECPPEAQLPADDRSIVAHVGREGTTAAALRESQTARNAQIHSPKKWMND